MSLRNPRPEASRQRSSHADGCSNQAGPCSKKVACPSGLVLPSCGTTKPCLRDVRYEDSA